MIPSHDTDPPSSDPREAMLPPSEDNGPLSAAARLTDLLLGAANVDRRATTAERDTTAERNTTVAILQRVLGRSDLPPRIQAKLDHFDPATFHLPTAVKRYSEKPAVDGRQLIELVHAVCEADGVMELSENGYMVALTLALGLDRNKVDDLVMVSALDGRGVRIKRAVDIALSLIAMLALALPLLLVALVIKFTSPGPVLFGQDRYGLDGRPFRVWKFRTMTVREDGAQIIQARLGDPRITPFGSLLRRTSLDELPQLVNVLRGDMSLVGPRPHAVAHNEKYKQLIPKYMLRHVIKPGITGWAQVNGWRGETDTLEKMVKRVEHDAHYIQHWTVLLDFKIMWLTVFGAAVRRNAY
jgi:putative colanic acid biosynthesis UDP-glucose lipid carrier transferase